MHTNYRLWIWIIQSSVAIVKFYQTDENFTIMHAVYPTTRGDDDCP